MIKTVLDNVGAASVMNLLRACLAISALVTVAGAAIAQDDFATPLPAGVRAVWDLDCAFCEATATRERVCLNGLWRWQPAGETADAIPAGQWGYFKVPGCWPGVTDYMQKDCQTVFAHPAWKDRRLSEVSTAWYEREITVPANWTGRRISLAMEYVNSAAVVWVDGQKAGEIRFPGGELDLNGFCRPGGKHRLSAAVTALPLKAVLLSTADTFGTRTVRGSVARRGLCGDVYLVSTPAGAKVADVRVETSVRRWELALEVALPGLDADAHYTLRAEITSHGRKAREIRSRPFTTRDLNSGRFAFTEHWKPDKLWDTVTPTNIYEASVSLLDARVRALDTALPARFGFREFWIDGRDFYLNGTRIFLCAVPLDNAQNGAAWATYAGTRETLQRLKSFGVNFVYTHNYGCEPGAHLSFAEALRAADDEGMLVSFSQPHFGQYDWKTPGTDQTNGYARHAEFYARAAANHPSVVFYSMSHNSVGTEEQMNPNLIDGLFDGRNQWSSNNAKLALRAEAIVKRLDPGRIVYHHSSGNLGAMHTANFYANFAPPQEMSDWFGHWASAGIKPVFLCEYGVPLSWDWMMYRGWYRGVREFGSALVPWELCLAEWNAQFFGAAAYQITDLEKECLRWEARQFRDGRLWHRWDYPRNASGSPQFDRRNEILAAYLVENLRAFRTWGLSAVCPWDHEIFWKLRDGTGRTRKELAVDWDALQRPGFSADYVDDQAATINTGFERTDWIPTAGAQALYRNNRPLLAYIGGKPAAFTSKDHNFYPGDALEKQVIIINNSRGTVSADCRWSLALPKPVAGRRQVRVETGQQARAPLQFKIPPHTPPGRYDLTATVTFSNGETQEDAFTLDVLPRAGAVSAKARIALFDPKGETGRLLKNLGVVCTPVEPAADLSGYALLIVGKGALTPDDAGPDVGRVRNGLKVLMFEQTSEVLERRFGFRVEEYGLRWVFRRVPDHPLLAGLGEEHLRNWRGEATLLPAALKYEIGQRRAPEVKWCGLPVTRLWRAGNRGNVASVLIEKPARGDFLPIVDGGFGLQFSPLMEYREGKGLVLFCQMDVTGRTEDDPAAETLARNLVQYAAEWKPTPRRQVVYAGDEPGRRHLEQAGFSPRPYEPLNLSAEAVLVVGAGGGTKLAPDAEALAAFASAGGRVLALGLEEAEANSFLPLKVKMRRSEHIAAFFPPGGWNSPLAGVSPADVHNRDPRELPLVASGATVVGNGVLAEAGNAHIVFSQLAPWTFAGSGQNHLRRTYRRAAFLTTRLLSNFGAESRTPVLERFQRPAGTEESRWLSGLYLDAPLEWDDPYRFFCW